MKNKITAKPGTTTNNLTGGWRTYKPKINLDKCISCGMCEKVCPEGIVKMEENKKYNKNKPQIDYDFCKGCGVCAEECPVKAIEMKLENK